MLITREPDRLRLTGYPQNEQIGHVPDLRLARSWKSLRGDIPADLPTASPQNMERGGLRWGLAGGALIHAAMQAQSLDSNGVP